MDGSDIMKKSMLLLFLVSVLFIVGCSEPSLSAPMETIIFENDF